MLSVDDLVDIKYIPSESDISLKLLVDFYEDYLCKRIFIFTLRDGQVVKLFFRDATEIFHVSGINHIYEGLPMDGSRFIHEIKSGKIDLGTVKNVNTAAYKDYEIRICSIACIDTIIKNCEYLWYPSGKISDSNIEVKYLLLKGLNEKNLHLGIDTYRLNRPYFAKTLLITEGDNTSKFIDRADERLKVSKLQIRDKDTNKIMVLIERELAEQTAMAEVEKYAKEWFSKELPVLLKNHFVENLRNRVLEIFEQHTREESLGDKILYKDLMENIIKSNLELMEEYEDLYASCIHTGDKKAWGVACKRYIEQNKLDIKNKVEKFDSYWTGKIVGEAIRKYNKEKMSEDLSRYIAEYSSSELINVVADLLVEN